MLSEVSFDNSLERKVEGIGEYPREFYNFVLYYFTKYLTHKVSPFHLELCELIKYRQGGVAAPRTFAKSVYLSLFYPIYIAIKESCRVVVVSATSFLATDMLRHVKGEFENNELLREDFGDLVSNKWREDHIILRNGGEIIARSVSSQIRGLHPRVLILDDAENDEETLNVEGRDGFSRFMKETVLPVANFESCQILMVGTILHPESYLNNIVQGRELGWTSRLYRSLNGDKSLWPSLWPVARLLDRKRELGLDAFEQEYQNNPIPDSQRAFKSGWFKYIDKSPELVNRFVTIDPAIELGEKNDDTVITVSSVDCDNNIYVEECIGGKMMPNEIIQNMFEVYNRKKVLVTGLETIAFQKVLKYMFEEESRKRKVYPLLEELKSDGRRKTWRIRALQPYFEQGKIFFVKGGIGIEKLESQLLGFPTMRHDDYADSLAYLLSIMRPGHKPKEPALHPESFEGVLNRIKEERNRTVIWGNQNLN